MNTTTGTRFVIADVVEILEADGWHRTWPACRNSVTDKYGNTAAVHNSYGEAVKVEFTYALPRGLMETLNLDPRNGAERIVRVIAALAAAPTE